MKKNWNVQNGKEGLGNPRFYNSDGQRLPKPRKAPADRKGKATHSEKAGRIM